MARHRHHRAARNNNRARLANSALRQPQLNAGVLRHRIGCQWYVRQKYMTMKGHVRLNMASVSGRTGQATRRAGPSNWLACARSRRAPLASNRMAAVNRPISIAGGIHSRRRAVAAGMPKSSFGAHGAGLSCGGWRGWAGNHHGNRRSPHAINRRIFDSISIIASKTGTKMRAGGPTPPDRRRGYRRKNVTKSTAAQSARR